MLDHRTGRQSSLAIARQSLDPGKIIRCVFLQEVISTLFNLLDLYLGNCFDALAFRICRVLLIGVDTYEIRARLANPDLYGLLATPASLAPVVSASHGSVHCHSQV